MTNVRHCTAALESAVRLYRGDLLDGFHVDADDFSDWLRAERERLRENLTQTLGRLLAHYSRAGAIADGIRVALRLLDLDPLQEAVHRTLLMLYVRQGRRAAALNHYRHLDDALDSERRSIQAGLAAGDVGVASFGAVTTAWVHLEAGDLTAAEAQCRDVLSGSSEPINAATALGLTALVDLERGHRERAVPVLEQVFTQLPVAARRELFASPLGEAYAAAGHVDRARETARRLTAMAATSPSRWRRGRLHRLEAVIAAAEHRVSDSKHALQCAVEDLMAVPAPLEIARTHMIAARLAARWNERETVSRSLALAWRGHADAGAKLRLRALDRLDLRCAP